MSEKGGTLRIKASKDLREVAVIVNNDSGDTLAEVVIRSPDEVRAIVIGLLQASAMAWPDGDG